MTNQHIEDIRLVPTASRKLLNQRQRVDYRDHREQLITWLLNVGKDPGTADGYSSATIEKDAYRLDQFYRWVWTEQTDGYTTNITQDHADVYVEHLAFSDGSNTHKANCVKAVKKLFKWKHHERGGELWEADKSFSYQPSKPQNYLTRRERTLIREAALEYGSIPAYGDVTPDERERWKAYLAQRFEKPKTEVTPKDWKRANGWKIPSLVAVSLDCGLRPCEVEKAVVGWVDLENQMLRIPKEDSAKNRDNWTPALREETVNYLTRWLEERQQYEKYAGRDALWLTRFGNAYAASSLKYLIERLCEIAEIPYSTPENNVDRGMSWYAIRHSVGTYMTHEEDLGAAQEQLRHKSEQTTMKYDQAPVEERRNALDRMG